MDKRWIEVARKQADKATKGPEQYSADLPEKVVTKDILLRNVPPELHRAIRISAAIAGQTMSAFILDVVVEAAEVKEAAELDKQALREGRS